MFDFPILSDILRRGVSMEQQKEPAFSAKIQTITSNPEPRLIPNMVLTKSINDISPQDIIRYAKLGKIVDERDNLPLHKKLQTCVNKKVVLIIDAIDDEPYISSQMAPIVHMREQLIEGIRLAAKAIDAKSCHIEIYKHMNELETRIPFSIGGIAVKRISGAYPAEVKEENSLMEIDDQLYLYLGSISMVHLYRAVYEGRIHDTTIVTVAGDCITNPCNIEAGFDIPVTDLLDRCGLTKTPSRIVVGGSMTGESIEDTDDTFVQVDTCAILALANDQKERNYTCIRCGRCNEVCPMHLNPMLIGDAIKLDLHEEADYLDYNQCIQCMCCSFECPAKINIAANIASYNKRRRAE